MDTNTLIRRVVSSTRGLSGLRALWFAAICGLAALMMISELPGLVFLAGMLGCIGGAAGMLIELQNNAPSI